MQRQLDAMNLMVQQDTALVTSDPEHAKADTPRDDEAKTRQSKDEAWTKAGSERSLNYIVGQVMKKTRVKASPGEVHNLVRAQADKL